MELRAKRRRNALATLAPVVVTFLGLLGLQLANAESGGAVQRAVYGTILFGFGPFSGVALNVLLGKAAALIALGVFDWTVIALLVLRTRAGNGHWIAYTAAVSAWLAVGFFVVAYEGLGG